MHESFIVFSSALSCTSPIAPPAQAKALKWMDSAGAGLPAGAQMAVVSGDPGKAGMFKVQIKMPADYAVPPHHHPTDEMVRVRSGHAQLRHGRQARQTNAGNAERSRDSRHHGGQHEPLGVHHRAGDGRGQRHGPFQITYVDPKDDPRK